MSAFSWIILNLAILIASAQEIYESPNSPHVYTVENGKFTCTYSVNDTVYTGAYGFGVSRIQTDGTRSVFGCAITRTPGKATAQADAINNEQISASVSTEMCNDAYSNLQNGGKLEIAIENIPVGVYKCTVYTDEYYDQAPEYTITELMVAPSMLELNIPQGTEVYAGDQIDMFCTSQGGKPVANFTYGNEGGPLNGYSVTKADHGKVLSCRDRSHPYLQGGDNSLTFAEKQLTVFYLEGTMKETKEMASNPTRNEMLTCATEQNLPENTTLEFNWTRDGEAVDGGDGKDLIVSIDPESNKTVIVKYECTASTNNPNLPVVKSSYQITWDPSLTTPPTTTPTTTTPKPTEKPKKPANKPSEQEGGNATMIIIIVVVVITVVILIIVIVIIVIKRRNSRQANVTKGAGKGSEQKSDAEKGNKDADAAAEEKNKLLESQENSKSESDSG